MEHEHELNNFALQVQQEIINIAEAEGLEKLRAEAFTQYMINVLVESGDLEDGIVAYHKARGIEVSGYYLESDDTLNLFTTCYVQAQQPEPVSKSDVEAYFKRLDRFLQKAFDQYYIDIEEASAAFDMAESIFECRNNITRVQFYLFTDGLTTIDRIPETTIHNLQISYHVWDLRRLYRYMSSGKDKEPIYIDFVEQFGAALPCIQWSDNSADYASYLTIIPGDILNDLYASHGARLLELNVRSYLQARGKVNKDIRYTILNEPEHFLAYNNGISATASQIELITLPEGGYGIKSLSDLQIVNGGQTTASIFHAARKDKEVVSRVRVQAKISVVAPDNIAKLVPRISRFANSQNKVNEADFSANDAFHVQLETLSRTIWAPAVDGQQRQTQWFYERARGQYQDALIHEATPARQRLFKETCPTTQKFTKTDVAKFEMTWEQLPYIVSQGAQKCFIQFTLRQQKRGAPDVNQAYFQHLIARAILFRQTEKIVAAQNFGGYRANVVTYTLAYIYQHTSESIDLDRIWQHQTISQGLRDAIKRVAHRVHEIIVSPPGGKNITEWCKRQECWAQVRNLIIDFPQSFHDELRRTEYTTEDSRPESIEDNDQLKHEMKRIPAQTWYQLSTWGKETRNIEARYRSLAFTLGQLQQHGRLPSQKQAAQGLQLLDRAYKLGFKPDTLIDIIE